MLLLGATISLWHYKDVIGKYRIEAELLRAYNAADVRLCEGRLCARIEPEAKGYGEHEEYRLVAPR